MTKPLAVRDITIHPVIEQQGAFFGALEFFPALTEDRRKDLVKHIHKVLENHRTAVRNVRRDIKEAVEKLEKEKKISEDDRKRSLEELEKITHVETKKIEDLSAAKEKEVLEIK